MNTHNKSGGHSDPREVKIFYNKNASTYDQTRLKTPFQKRFDATERAIVRRHIKKVGRILEVGAGTGRLTNELLAVSDNVTAVDISPGMLKELNCKYSGYENLNTAVANVYQLEKIPYYGLYDAMLSMRMLPHIEKIEEALSIFKSAVKKMGCSYLIFGIRIHMSILKRNLPTYITIMWPMKKPWGLSENPV